MIRSLLLAAGFLVVTIALLFLQPSPRDGLGSDDTFAPLPVTRADTTPSDPLTNTPARARTDLAVTEPVKHPKREVFGFNRPKPEADPSTAAPDDAGGLWSVVKSPDSPAPAPEPGDDAVQNQIAMMTQNILRELGSDKALSQPTPQLQTQQTREQPTREQPTLAPTAPSAAAPSPLLIAPVPPAVAASPVPASPVPATPVNAAFRSQLIDADTAGASDAQLEAMLRDAVSAGQITPSAEYKTALGDVDHTALLAALLPSRVGTPSVAVDKEFMYRVQPNDSLAGLSSLFYGDVKDYARILAANPETLSSASDVSPGMLLKIPGT